jgi:hypothetical protein
MEYWVSGLRNVTACSFLSPNTSFPIIPVLHHSGTPFPQDSIAPFPNMDTVAYLKRINYVGSLAPTAETLRQLHLAHLLAVPFENLSRSALGL